MLDPGELSLAVTTAVGDEVYQSFSPFGAGAAMVTVGAASSTLIGSVVHCVSSWFPATSLEYQHTLWLPGPSRNGTPSNLVKGPPDPVKL
jgi:hypothetical protein